MTEFSEDDKERNWCWFATDMHGHVAYLQSFGDGALLPEFCRCIENAELIDDYVFESMDKTLKPCCESIVCKENLQFLRVGSTKTGQTDSNAKEEYLQEIAKTASRGIFVYKPLLSSHRPVGYYQIVAPARPIHFTELPDEIAVVVEPIRFGSTVFSVAPKIGVECFS